MIHHVDNCRRVVWWPLTAAVLFVVSLTLLLMLSVGALAQSTTVLHDFNPYPNGKDPAGGLVQGGDGNFYGTTYSGGAGHGTVFQITPAGVLTTLHSFTGPDGDKPYASLVQGSDGNFYGTTTAGGTYGGGTVFKITTAGALTTLHSFENGSDGGFILAGLVQGSDGNFYGVACTGGANNDGTVYKITPAGALTTLYSFTGGSDEANPAATLVQASNGNFYGTTEDQYSGGDGTVFMITPAGALTTLYTFTGSDGASPLGGLTQGSDGNLYGTTESGGFNDGGIFYEMTPGGALTSLYSFGSGGPAAALIKGTDGNFYGTTFSQGGSGGGAIFMITPAGVPTTLYGFSSSNSQGALIQASDGNFYGTTSPSNLYNGLSPVSSLGSIFKVTPTGCLTTIYSFVSSEGSMPSTGLVQGSDGNYYGTTTEGGASLNGTVFKMAPDGVLTTLYSFADGDDGGKPVSGVIQGSDGNFYGTTSAGGAYLNGTVFMITPAGVLTTLHAFTNGPDGAGPYGGLIQGADGKFYGTTAGGGIYLGEVAAGTVFKITPGGDLTTLYTFTDGTDGANPQASLVQGSDGNFYGTTDGYGAGGFNEGTVFKITPAGCLTTLYQFTGANGIFPDGSDPNGTLVEGSDGNFYGTTSDGGEFSSYGYGAVFMITPAGALTVLHSFVYLDGAYPRVGLVQGTDGNFYGTTPGPDGLGPGGVGNGTAFLITPTGALTTLHAFNGTNGDGASPDGVLLQAGNEGFYGTSASGGAYDGGTVFALTVALPAPKGLTATGGPSQVTLSWAAGAGASSYNVYRGTSTGGEAATPFTTGVSTTAYTDTTATDGITYYYEVAAVSASGTSGFSNEASATPETFTSVYSFTSSDGTNPYAGLTKGADGNYYGVDSAGGANGDGTVFQVTPAGVMTTIYSFSGATDGSDPTTQLVLGGDDNLYGTTGAGGPNNAGTIFMITASGTLTTLYPFFSSNLIVGPDGDLYGTTYAGGSNNEGSIFKIGLGGTGLTVLYSFSGSGSDGGNPLSGLTQASDGNFYGTTTQLDFGGPGTIFQFTPSSGTLTTLHTFNGTDGWFILGSLIEGVDGNLYGTSGFGGNAYQWNGDGSIFEISTGGVFTTLHTFEGPDGANPDAGLMLGTDSSLYGVNADGGLNGDGTVYRLGSGGSVTTLYSFSGPDGNGPLGSLIQGQNGSLYGTTELGGTDNDGTIFNLNLGLPSPAPAVPPLANNDSYSTTAGQTLTVASPGVLANDTDIYGDPLTAIIASNPSNGSLTLNSNGSFTYTPHSGYIGTDTFTYKAQDSTDHALLSNPATVSITVNPLPVTVATPANATPNPVTGKTTNLNVFGAYAGTGGAGVLTYDWSSTGPAAVTFSANGTTAARNSVATFSMAGSYTFTATITGPYGQTATSSVNVTVNSTLASVAVTPGPTLTLTAPATQTFSATANDQFGAPLATQPAFTWTLVGGGVGSIVNNVYSTAGVPGTATVKAKTGSIFGSVAITVNPAPVTVATPANASPSPVTGRTTNLNVLGAYAGASGAGILTYTWSSTGPASVAFSANGTNTARNCTATFSAAGTYTLTATIASPYTSITSSVNVTVNQTYTSIAISPGPTLTLTAPATQQFTATTLDQFGNPMAAQPAFTWSLAGGSIGSITSSGGLYHSGTSPGSATIKAKSGAISSTVAVTVNPAPVTVATAASANPNPAPSTMTNLSATGAYAGTGGAASLTYTWSVSGPAAVTYSANGTNAAGATIATFTNAGAYTFTVTIASAYTSTTSSVTVNVAQTVTSIGVTPGPTLTLGPPLPQTQQFSAAALDQFGNAVTPAPTFAWSLAAGGVGSISSVGLFHSGTVAGSATVRAKSGTVMGTCTVTVN